MQQTIRFRVDNDKKYHIERQLWDGTLLGLQSRWERPRGEGDVGALVVTKSRTVLEQDLAAYESQMKTLEGLVRPLRGEYLEKLLGEDVYRELVLLESIRSDDEDDAEDSTRRKRPAGGGTGDAGKRRRVSER